MSNSNSTSGDGVAATPQPPPTAGSDADLDQMMQYFTFAHTRDNPYAGTVCFELKYDDGTAACPCVRIDPRRHMHAESHDITNAATANQTPKQPRTRRRSPARATDSDAAKAVPAAAAAAATAADATTKPATTNTLNSAGNATTTPAASTAAAVASSDDEEVEEDDAEDDLSLVPFDAHASERSGAVPFVAPGLAPRIHMYKAVNDIPSEHLPVSATVSTDRTNFVRLYWGTLHPRTAVLTGQAYVYGLRFRELANFLSSFDFKKWDEFFAYRKSVDERLRRRQRRMQLNQNAAQQQQIEAERAAEAANCELIMRRAIANLPLLSSLPASTNNARSATATAPAPTTATARVAAAAPTIAAPATGGSQSIGASLSSLAALGWSRVRTVAADVLNHNRQPTLTAAAMQSGKRTAAQSPNSAPAPVPVPVPVATRRDGANSTPTATAPTTDHTPVGIAGLPPKFRALLLSARSASAARAADTDGTRSPPPPPPAPRSTLKVDAAAAAAPAAAAIAGDKRRDAKPAAERKRSIAPTAATAPAAAAAAPGAAVVQHSSLQYTSRGISGGGGGSGGLGLAPSPLAQWRDVRSAVQHSAYALRERIKQQTPALLRTDATASRLIGIHHRAVSALRDPFDSQSHAIDLFN